VLHVPDSGKISRARRAGLAAVLTIVVAAAAVGVAAATKLTAHSSAAGSGNQRPTARPTLTPAQAAVAAQALANGKAASIWVAGHVGHGLVIGCDPATCAAILGASYPTRGQVVLQQGASLPGPGSVIVATPAVRSLYGPLLLDDAPAVIAAFGSGAAAVQVRVAFTGGPQAYNRAASRALSARRRAGRKLLQQPNLHTRAVAKKDLGSGLVDPRVIGVLRRLAERYPLFVVRFGDAGPQAGRTVPFRMVEITVPTTQAGQQMASELAGMKKLLRRLPARDRPELMPMRKVHGKRVLEFTFPAPSPF
jgi:hypothetical protein